MRTNLERKIIDLYLFYVSFGYSLFEFLFPILIFFQLFHLIVIDFSTSPTIPLCCIVFYGFTPYNPGIINQFLPNFLIVSVSFIKMKFSLFTFYSVDRFIQYFHSVLVSFVSPFRTFFHNFNPKKDKINNTLPTIFHWSNPYKTHKKT